MAPFDSSLHRAQMPRRSFLVLVVAARACAWYTGTRYPCHRHSGLLRHIPHNGLKSTSHNSMTRRFSKSLLAQRYCQIALYINANSRNDLQQAFGVIVDEFRLMAVSAAEAEAVLKRIGSPLCMPPTILANSKSTIHNLQIRNYQCLQEVEAVRRPTCDACCHYQSHPPRCQFSKRAISPNQFSCKKYSSKYRVR